MLNSEDIKSIYDGHEIEVHTLMNSNFYKCASGRISREVQDDRLRQSGKQAIGCWHGTSRMNGYIAKAVKERTGVRYARIITSTYSFDIQSDSIVFHPTGYHHRDWEAPFVLGK